MGPNIGQQDLYYKKQGVPKNQPATPESRKLPGGPPGLPKFRNRVQGGSASQDKGHVRASTLSDPEYDAGLMAGGHANEVGLKSILEDSRLSREFDAGVDIHNMRNELGLGVSSR